MRSFPVERLKQTALSELARRRLDDGRYADMRDRTAASLVGLHTAARILACVGEPVPAELGTSIVELQSPDGDFRGAGEKEHKLCMTLIALNLAGAVPRYPMAGLLAPGDVAGLRQWLAAHDWATTHKRLSYGVLPTMAAGDLPHGWTDTLFAALEANFDRWLQPARKGPWWHRLLAPPAPMAKWAVISRLYHILVLYSLAGRPYPRQDELKARLDGLDWPAATSGWNFCTDFDYATMIEHLPYVRDEKLDRFDRLLDRQLDHLEADLASFASVSIHQISNYLTRTAVFQRLLPERFTGPVLRDVLHEKALLAVPAARERVHA